MSESAAVQLAKLCALLMNRGVITLDEALTILGLTDAEMIVHRPATYTEEQAAHRLAEVRKATP